MYSAFVVGGSSESLGEELDLELLEVVHVGGGEEWSENGVGLDLGVKGVNNLVQSGFSSNLFVQALHSNPNLFISISKMTIYF